MMVINQYNNEFFFGSLIIPKPTTASITTYSHSLTLR